MKEVSFRIGKEMDQKGRSKIDKYCDLVIGQRGFWPLFKYELVMLLASHLPGALGLFLRSKLYPLLLKKCGRNTVFGSNVVLRHPHKIEIGDNVIIDDNCLLDAKGSDNRGIVIENNVFVGRNTILSSKNGDIILEDSVNIGFNSYLFSGSLVRLGPHCLVAAYCYFIGGDHSASELDKTIYEQNSKSFGISVGANCWFGADVKVQDKVTIGDHCVIGTGAVVTKDLPEYSVAVGIPAKAIRDRRQTGEKKTGEI